MSSSNLKSFMKKFNVSKPTDMPDIPEEKFGPDGRPLSTLSQAAGKGDDKRGSVTSTVSELSTATTQVGTGLGINGNDGKGGAGTDLLVIPEDVQAPVAFGPRNEYKAVPSIIEYSTARGRSRVSIREATPEEAKEAAGKQMPIISDLPQFSTSQEEEAQHASDIPRLAPPPNFQPIQTQSVPEPTHPALSSHPTRHLRAPIASVSESLRTSTTSIRTSTTDQSIRTSCATDVDDSISEVGSMASTLNAPGSPPQRATPAPEYSDFYKNSEKAQHSPTHSGSWPSVSASSNASMRSRGYPPSYDTTQGVTPRTNASSFDAAQSRFSWHVSKTEKAQNWFTRWFIEWWAMEILSWCFSAVCMMIIIIVLARVDNKPMPTWKLGVSINAFISIFSGFAKSALLLPTAEALGQLKWSWFTGKQKSMMDFEVLDSASRGPWGSMMLLAKTKGITLASVGAAIILLSLPLDLFFQQIIAYPSTALVDKHSNATISRAILYDANPEIQWRNGSQTLIDDSQFDAFIYPYWLGSGVVPGVEFDCPTGNCTWTPFETLGFDYECKELPADFLEFDCKDASAEWMSTVAYAGPGQNPNVSSCGWYMNVPGFQPQLMSGYEVEADGGIGEVLATRFYSLGDLWSNQLFYNGSISFRDVNNPLIDFVVASTPGGFEGASRNATPVVSECEIHWVVKTIEAKVLNGNLTETALETRQFPMTYWSDLTGGWDPEDATSYLANYSMVLPDPNSVTGPNSEYGVSNITARKVWQVWTQIAPGSFVRPAESNPVKSGPVLKIKWLDNPPHLAEVRDAALPWDAPANVSQHMGQAVTVMNQIVRRNTLSLRHRHDVAVGQALKYVVLVDIRWQWITLPVALLIFALVFLGVTMYRSSKDKQQIGIWKTSALAILFNGLGDDVQGYVGAGNKSQGYTRRKARDIKVQLDDD